MSSCVFIYVATNKCMAWHLNFIFTCEHKAVLSVLLAVSYFSILSSDKYVTYFC